MGGQPRQVWRTLGRLVAPQPNGTWWASHASYPTALSLPDGSVRVFFSTRGSDNRSSLASVKFAIDGARWEQIEPVQGPLLEPGPRGAFDADGVTVTCVVPHDGRLLAYYLGWTVCRDVPFTNFIGLAIGNSEGDHFERWSPAPILGRSRENPFCVGYPWVLRTGDGLSMWYGSHLHWGSAGIEMEHVIKEAWSPDGLVWTTDDHVAVDLARDLDPLEFALSRPVVLSGGGSHLSMWYAKRRPCYRLGYASSIDGRTWSRSDDVLEFAGELEDWESSERTYPCVFDHNHRRYMLYNGDGYGKTGFGLAVWE